MIRYCFYAVILCCLLLPEAATAQIHEPGIFWGGEVFKPSSSTSFQVIGNWPEGILLQTRTRTKLFSPGKTYIERFDDMTMLPQYTREVKLETTRGNKSLEYEVLERVGDHPVLFATYFNKDKNRIELYGRRYNMEGEPIDREKKIGEFAATRKSQLEALNFVQSADSSKMLTFFSERFNRYQNEKIEFTLFDRDLEQLWNRSIEFPYPGKNFTIYRSMVDKNGRVYLLIKVTLDKGQLPGKGAPPFRYGLVTFGADTSLVEDYEITLDDNFITDIHFAIDASGNIICSGFYSSKGLNRAAGTFYLEIDRQQKQITGKRMRNFDREFAARFADPGRSRNKPELTDFKLDHLVRFPDSSLALVAEQFLVDEICYQDFRTGMISCNYIYIYNNIIVIKMNAAGDVQWTADIPKFQESSNDGGIYSSYTLGVSGSNLYFVFNDDPKNATEKDERKIRVMSTIRKAEPALVKIDAEGRFSRRSLASSKKSRLYFEPRYSCQISSRSMVLFGVTTNKFRVGILPLE